MHMRTTIVISDSLANRAKKHMERHRVTLRALVEAGLERVLDERSPARGFRLRDAAFSGERGFSAGVSADDLPQVLRQLNDPLGRQDDA